MPFDAAHSRMPKAPENVNAECAAAHIGHTASLYEAKNKKNYFGSPVIFFAKKRSTISTRYF